MFEMQADVLRAFLDEPRAAVLATLRRDGRPYTIPLWFLWEGEVPDDVNPASNPPSGHVWFTGAPTSSWCKHLVNDPRMSLCIDQEEPPAKHVGIDGTVEHSAPDDPEVWPVLKRLVDKYVGRGDPANQVEADGYLESMRSMTPILFKVTPNAWRAIDLSEFEPGQDL